MITWQHLHRSSKFTWSSRSCTCSASWTCRNISRPRVCKSNSCFLSSSLRRDLSWWSHRFFWKITSNDALMFTYFSFPWPPASVFTSHLWSAWPWTVRMSTKYLKKPGVQRSHDLPICHGPALRLGEGDLPPFKVLFFSPPASPSPPPNGKCLITSTRDVDLWICT